MRHLGDDDWTDLNESQEKALDFIESCIDIGLPPTRAEIAQHLDFRSRNAAQELLVALESKGRIQLLPRIARGIKLVGP